MARTGAAVLMKDFHGILRLDGTERVSWLQGMVSNDVKKLTPGQGCYAAHLSPQGKTVAQMVILKDADCLWLELERPVVQPLAAAFDKLLIMEDVQVADVSETTSILALIEWRWGLYPLTDRDAAANNLLNAFDYSQA